MFESAHFVFAAFFSSILLSYFRITRAIMYSGGVPRVGGGGVLGYMITALRYTLDAEPIILKGRADFGGRPFVIPTLASFLLLLQTGAISQCAFQAGPVFLLGPEYLDSVRSSTDDVVSPNQKLTFINSLIERHSSISR